MLIAAECAIQETKCWISHTTRGFIQVWEDQKWR